jgi:6-pyruvoyltetrahydropterin/6-carboxytetrahydropterin synthase
MLEVGMTHKITLERNTLRFAAAHFTASSAECEPLHGHNYDTFIELEGELTADSWVIDFGVAKKLTKEICKSLDHRLLLAARSQFLIIGRSDSEITVSGPGKRYVVPESDVVVLDIDNTTAERLAEWFTRQLADRLVELGVTNIVRVTVGVEEMPGQAGWFTLDIANGP